MLTPEELPVDRGIVTHSTGPISVRLGRLPRVSAAGARALRLRRPSGGARTASRTTSLPRDRYRPVPTGDVDRPVRDRDNARRHRREGRGPDGHDRVRSGPSDGVRPDRCPGAGRIDRRRQSRQRRHRPGADRNGRLRKPQRRDRRHRNPPIGGGRREKALRVASHCSRRTSTIS